MAEAGGTNAFEEVTIFRLWPLINRGFGVDRVLMADELKESVALIVVDYT